MWVFSCVARDTQRVGRMFLSVALLDAQPSSLPGWRCLQEKPEVVKTHLRNMVIMPEMIGSMVGVYNGKTFNQVEIKVGHASPPPHLAWVASGVVWVARGRRGLGLGWRGCAFWRLALMVRLRLCVSGGRRR